MQDEFQVQADAVESKVAESGKRAYTTPELQQFGSIADLTRGDIGTHDDGLYASQEA